MDFVFPADHRVKIRESEKITKYLDLARELKKAVEHEVDGDTNCNWSTWTGPKRLEWKKVWRNWKLKEDPRQSRLQYCRDLQEIREKV